ncbi:MAG TPA: 2Fe-2S iron-sulfur cluster-binding protein [Desulfoprunum sp.]|nr:2Fe-2S iron-sulfur cluster-binding protein [Desulfoprunum sp.]
MITIHINDQPVSVEPETTVLQAARSHGIAVPTLCHHPALKASGSCRICAVAVEKVTGEKTVMLSCLLKVKPGMRLWTQGAEVRQARTKALLKLNAMAPMSERIRHLAAQEGIELPPAPDGCIRCRLCVRVCKEIVGQEALRMELVDDRQLVIPDPDRCIGCGTCANICPTQAITVREDGGMRTISIRGAVFGRQPLLRCQGCGKYYATEKQILLMEKRTAPHPQVKEHHNYCANCAKLLSNRLQVLEKQPPRQQTTNKRQR